MARGLGRSKGCQNCLQRKIKCDEKTPSCTQCTRGGRQCSGALSTVFLIVESETVNTNPTYKPRDNEQASQKSEKEQSTSLARSPKKSGHASTKTSRRNTQLKSSKLNDLSLPLGVQSSQVITDQFLSHFITFFSKLSVCEVIFNSWMVALPEMLSAKSAVIEKSIIAASMVFAGRDSGSPSIVMESYKWYGLGIAKQRKMVDELQREQRVPTIEEICTPILLSFFEITCNTSPTGYFQHLMGAARFLEMRGPEDCSSGILHQIFLTLRIQVLHPAILLRIPSIFATEEWLTIPFQCRPKSVFDKVIDVITKISSMISRLEARRFKEDSSEAEIQRILVEKEATKTKEQLDQWWDKELRDASRTHGWNGDHFRGVPGFDFDYDCLQPKSSFTKGPMMIQYSDKSLGTEYPTAPPTGREVRFYGESRATAFYSTARILILSILNDLGSPPSLFKEQMEAHCESILSVATFLTRFDIGLSLLSSQKERAQLVLQTWSQKGGVAGLCEVVLSDLGEQTC